MKQLRIIDVEKSDIEKTDTERLKELFDASAFAGNPEDARQLRGNCAISLKTGVPTPDALHDPCREYVQKLHSELPHLAYFLCPLPELEALHKYIACLLPKSINSDGSYDALSEEVVDLLLEMVMSVQDFCIRIGDAQLREAISQLACYYPEEFARKAFLSGLGLE